MHLHQACFADQYLFMALYRKSSDECLSPICLYKSSQTYMESSVPKFQDSRLAWVVFHFLLKTISPNVNIRLPDFFQSFGVKILELQSTFVKTKDFSKNKNEKWAHFSFLK